MVLQLLQHGIVSVSAHLFQQDQWWEILFSENNTLYLSSHPSTVGSENQTGPLVSSFSFPCFSVCQAEQILAGLHRKSMVDVLDILAQAPESYKGVTANHISTLNQSSTLCRSCPAPLQLLGWKKCQKSLPGASTSPGLLLLPAAGCGAWLLFCLSLGH